MRRKEIAKDSLKNPEKDYELGGCSKKKTRNLETIREERCAPRGGRRQHRGKTIRTAGAEVMSTIDYTAQTRGSVSIQTRSTRPVGRKEERGRRTRKKEPIKRGHTTGLARCEKKNGLQAVAVRGKQKDHQDPLSQESVERRTVRDALEKRTVRALEGGGQLVPARFRKGKLRKQRPQRDLCRPSRPPAGRQAKREILTKPRKAGENGPPNTFPDPI